MPKNYRHNRTEGEAIDTAGPILTLESADTTHVALHVSATAAADFAIEARFGPNSEWVQMYEYNAVSSLNETFVLPVFALRLAVTGTAAAGETATAYIGAN